MILLNLLIKNINHTNKTSEFYVTFLFLQAKNTLKYIN